MTDLADFQGTAMAPAASDRTGNATDFWRSLAAEMVFVADEAGICCAFHWQPTDGSDPNAVSPVGRPLVEAIAPADPEAFTSTIETAIRDRRTECIEGEFFWGGRSRSISWSIAPLPEGDTVRVLAIGRQQSAGDRTLCIDTPVTTRAPSSLAAGMANGHRLLSRIAHPKLLIQLAREIRHTLNLETIWQQTAKGLGSALEASRCWVGPYQPGDSTVKVAAEYRADDRPSLLATRVSLEDYIDLRSALETFEPLACESAGEGQPEGEAALIVPTGYQGRVNGAIVLWDDAPRQWSTTEREVIWEIADQVGTAVAHATLYEELERARQAAEEASRLKSDFLANTSHELRTPLNGTIGFLKLVLDGMADDPEEQEEFVREAHRSAIHLLSIINDILDIAKIEAGKMEIDLEPVSLTELFDRVKDFTEFQAQEKNLYFQVQLPDTEDEITLFSNYQRLLQVMLNLTGNAIKFTHEGGVTISAEVMLQKVRLRDREFPGYVKILVADTGIGVSLDQQNKLFQSFSQVDGSRTRQYGGTGLGLAISQKLVEAMGGIVNFYSMGEGLGSTVTFTVPLFQEPVMVSSQSIDEIDAMDLLI